MTGAIIKHLEMFDEAGTSPDGDLDLLTVGDNDILTKQAFLLNALQTARALRVEAMADPLATLGKKADLWVTEQAARIALTGFEGFNDDLLRTNLDDEIDR